jgi:hypothetical protein
VRLRNKDYPHIVVALVFLVIVLSIWVGYLFLRTIGPRDWLPRQTLSKETDFPSRRTRFITQARSQKIAGGSFCCVGILFHR